MKKIFKFLPHLLCAVLMLGGVLTIDPSFAAGTGKTYYVSVSGNDQSNGTGAATAFKTFKKALSVANPGDTILAKGGVYSEKVTFSKSGAAGAPITLKNAPGETPVLDGTGITAADEGMINLYSKSYITVSGFEIRNLKTSKTRT